MNYTKYFVNGVVGIHLVMSFLGGICVKQRTEKNTNHKKYLMKWSTDSLMTVKWRSDMTKKKLKRIEKDISMMKHSLELVRTVVPVLVLIMQVIILTQVV